VAAMPVVETERDAIKRNFREHFSLQNEKTKSASDQRGHAENRQATPQTPQRDEPESER
jgi:hypothetical protein